MGKLKDAIVLILRTLLGILLLSLILLLFVNVILRYFFAKGIAWAEEVTLYGFVCMVFLGLPLLTLSNTHIRVDVIYQFVSEKTKRILTNAGLVIEAFLGILLGIPATQLALKVFRAGQISPAAHLPVWIFNLALPIGFFGLTLLLILNLFKRRQ